MSQPRQSHGSQGGAPTALIASVPPNLPSATMPLPPLIQEHGNMQLAASTTTAIAVVAGSMHSAGGGNAADNCPEGLHNVHNAGDFSHAYLAEAITHANQERS